MHVAAAAGFFLVPAPGVPLAAPALLFVVFPAPWVPLAAPAGFFLTGEVSGEVGTVSQLDPAFSGLVGGVESVVTTS